MGTDEFRRQLTKARTARPDRPHVALLHPEDFAELVVEAGALSVLTIRDAAEVLSIWGVPVYESAQATRGQVSWGYRCWG